MSYAPLPQASTTKLPLNYIHDDDDILHNIPSSFDLALNGSTNRSFLSSKTSSDPNFLHPNSFHRLSIGSTPSSRSPSPHIHPPAPKTWRSSLHSFWEANQSLFLVALSQLFGALMNVTTRLLELEGDGMHPFQILFARQGLTMIFCTAWMWWKKVDGFPLGNRGVRSLLVARACSGFWGIFGMYYSLQYLPVADATVITFLAPSVASYGCYLLFREPFPRSAQYASLVAFIGVVLIAKPFSSSSPSPAPSPFTTNSTVSTPEISTYPTPTTAQRFSAVFFALLGVLGAAGAFTTIRYIGTRAHPLISVNYFSSFCFLISTLFLTLSSPIAHAINPSDPPASVSFSLPNGPKQWSQLLFLGICGFTMQYLLTTGLGGKKGVKGGGARATNMVYTNMLFSLGLDRLVFGVVPGKWSLVGGGLVLGSAVFVGITKEKAAVGSAGIGNGPGREAGTRDEEMAMLSLGAVEMEVDVDGEHNRNVRRGSGVGVGEDEAQRRGRVSDLRPPRTE